MKIDILKHLPLTNSIVSTILIEIIFQVGYIDYYEKRRK